MHLGPLDWSIIATTFAVYLAVGLWAGRAAGSGFEAFFLGNRGQPWWLLGTSMVATTFATDTPNLVAGIVRLATWNIATEREYLTALIQAGLKELENKAG